jgi:hypothetical protein
MLNVLLEFSHGIAANAGAELLLALGGQGQEFLPKKKIKN